MHAIEAAVFDLGKVLIDYDWNNAFHVVSRKTGLSIREIESRILTDVFFDFERGQISPEEYHRHAQRVLGLEMPFQEFHSLWISIFTAEIEPTVSLVRELSRSGCVKVGVLSNTNVLHIDLLERTWPLLSEIHHPFYSHKIHCRKPSREAFEHVLNGMGIRPERTVFVDDLVENVRAAESLGIQGIVAKSGEQVVRDFKAMTGWN